MKEAEWKKRVLRRFLLGRLKLVYSKESFKDMTMLILSNKGVSL